MKVIKSTTFAFSPPSHWDKLCLEDKVNWLNEFISHSDDGKRVTWYLGYGEGNTQDVISYATQPEIVNTAKSPQFPRIIPRKG